MSAEVNVEQASVVEASQVVEVSQQVEVMSREQAKELVYTYAAYTNGRPDLGKTNARRTHLVHLLERQDAAAVQEALAKFAAEDEDTAS